MTAQAAPAHPATIDDIALLEDAAARGAGYVLEFHGWTAAEYLEKAPENRFCEYWEGTVVLHSPVSTRHQDVVALLTALMRFYTSARGLGKVLNGPGVVRLGEGAYFEPDIFFVSREALGRIEEQYLDGPPALAVEVLSPSSRRRDLVDKAEMYRKAGVAEYWAIDGHSEEVRVYVNRPDPSESVVKSGRLESVAVQGFSIDVGWLWQDPLPPDAELVKQYL